MLDCGYMCEKSKASSSIFRCIRRQFVSEAYLDWF